MYSYENKLESQKNRTGEKEYIDLFIKKSTLIKSNKQLMIWGSKRTLIKTITVVTETEKEREREGGSGK